MYHPTLKKKNFFICVTVKITDININPTVFFYLALLSWECCNVSQTFDSFLFVNVTVLFALFPRVT